MATESSIDLKWVAENQPSLFIPHVFPNISEGRIRRIFDELALGEIAKIDMVERTNERGPYKRVYIHFHKWYKNEEAENARRRLLGGKEIKIVYDEPWFWKVSANRTRERNEDTRRQRRPPSRPRLEMSDDEDERKQTEEPLHRNVTVRKPKLKRQTNIEVAVVDEDN
jgi:hypothetical protein